MNLTTSISNLNDYHQPKLWQLSESYLNINDKAYQITKCEQNNISIKEIKHKKNIWITALKIASFFTIILPLFALSIRAIYRNRNKFNLVQDKPPYELDDVIAKIKKASQDGKKIGLFVGRRSDQSVPKEDGWLWVSLDVAKSDIQENNRLHLQMDFNNLSLVNKVKKTFNKVLVDYSTLKFMDNPWPTLHRLLINDPTSVLITETDQGITVMTCEETSYNPRLATKTLNYNDDEEDCQQILREKMKTYLKTNYFDTVELKNERYPYAGDKGPCIHFFIAQGPKTPQK